MTGTRRTGTKPEMAVRSAVHAMGLRYRVDRPVVGSRRRADLVFSRARVAVFVDGCFWHRCPSHYVPPRTNPMFWAAKVDTNVARDRDTDDRLREAGWLVVRVWEHLSAAEAARAVADAVGRRDLAHGPPDLVGLDHPFDGVSLG